jgi:hypothetical protein
MACEVLGGLEGYLGAIIYVLRKVDFFLFGQPP